MRLARDSVKNSRQEDKTAFGFLQNPLADSVFSDKTMCEGFHTGNSDGP